MIPTANNITELLQEPTAYAKELIARGFTKEEFLTQLPRELLENPWVWSVLVAYDKERRV